MICVIWVKKKDFKYATHRWGQKIIGCWWSGGQSKGQRTTFHPNLLLFGHWGWHISKLWLTSLPDLALCRVHTGSSLSTSRGLDSTTWMSSISKNLAMREEKSQRVTGSTCVSAVSAPRMRGPSAYGKWQMCLHNMWENVFTLAAEAWFSHVWL